MATLVLKAARVIDATGAPAIENGVVVVEGNRIKAVGRAGDFSLPPEGAEMIDAGDRTIIPGLMDVHTHLCSWTHSWHPWADLTILHDTQEAIADTAIFGVKNCRNFIKQGVTTIRDIGARHAAVFSLKKACARGEILGPRVFAAGKAIAVTGGQGLTVGCEVDGADGVRKLAREQLKAGADLIKLMVSGPGAGAASPYEIHMTIPEIAAACEEAHHRGKHTTCHAVNAQAAMDAITGGIDCIEHGLLLDEKTLKEMKARGVFWVPTLWTYQNTAWHGADYGTEPWIIERVQRITQAHLHNFQMAYAMGVKLAAGTDCGLPINPPKSLTWELEWFVRLGMSPMDAIRSATQSSAELLRESDELGTLQPGKLADMTIVEGNPLQNISALGDVWLVVKDGKVVVRDGDSESFDQPVEVGAQAVPDDWRERLERHIKSTQQPMAAS